MGSLPLVEKTNKSVENLGVDEKPQTSKSITCSFPMQNSPQMLSASGSGIKRPRRKVALKPGHSPLDWERLMSSGEDLRGVDELRKLSADEIAEHNKRDDCWIVIFDKVYNVTRYLDFHPGGRGQIMRVAGKDGTKLFMETHSWVNAERMLRECLVGFIIREPAKNS